MTKKLFLLSSLVIAFVLAGNASASLVAQYKLDDNSGTIATDEIGSNDGTMISMDSGSDWVSGHDGYALDFDGVDDCVNVPALGISSTAASISAWIKRDGDQEDWAGIVFRQESSIWFGQNFGTDNELRYHWNATNWSWDSGITVPDNTWVLAVLAVESTKATYYMVNGTVISSAANVNTHTAEDWTGVIRIGRAGFYAGRLFDGVIDDVRMYDQTLTEDDVRALAGIGGLATDPTPVDGLGVEPGVTLTWIAGDYVQATNEHMVYLGTAWADVNSATTDSDEYVGVRDVANYAPSGLIEGQKYYWRIDEVNTANEESPWKGNIWSFTIFRDVKADTWVATDDLDRTLPGYDECGPVRSDREGTTGIFYFLWLDQHDTDGPWDITDILEADPYSPDYGAQYDFHHWGHPEFDYYTSNDGWVMRKHAYMLADAGVDVVVFDVTNGPTYSDCYMELCEVWRTMRAEGEKTPQVTFVTNSDAVNVVATIYNAFYKAGNYEELWYYWDGKPLIFSVLAGHSGEVSSFFTIKRAWAWTYGEDTWNFMDYTPQRFGYDTSGTSDIPEGSSLSLAQHPTTNIGRSYHSGSQPYNDPLYHLTGYEEQGLYAAEQGDRALNLDPEFLYITGWNEWVAQRGISDGSVTMCGSTVASGGTFFVDAFNAEYSRDAEPMKDGYTDNYYYQLVDTVRRREGVRPPEAASDATTISVDGSFSDWDDVTPEFRDHIYDTEHRSEAGWQSYATLTNTTGRNDFKTLKVARDSTNVYFYVETREDITSYTDTNWMLLFIDSDQDNSTGWEGYDYLVNLSVVDSDSTTLKSNSGGTWSWSTESSSIDYAKSGTKMEIEIPRSLIDQGSGTDPVKLDFHWADNMQDTVISAFFNDGDSAPQRRFKYRYNAPSDVDATLLDDGFESSFDNWTDGGATDWARSSTEYYTGSYSAQATDVDNDLISDNLDTSDANAIRISFRYRTDDGDASDVVIQYYDSGSAYDTIEDLGDDEEDVWLYYSDTIYNTGGDTQYFHSNFRIKFEATNLASGENFWVDDVLITTIKAGATEGDTTAPSPDPMTWATDPAAGSTSTITMTATTATDANDVEYYFDETSGHSGGSDSGWQDGTGYTDTGLSEGEEYTYIVRARDKSENQNATAWSESRSARTTDNTAPSPNPMTWSVNPNANGTADTITMTATTATDVGGVEYYFDETTGNPGGSDSGWQNDAAYTDTGLSETTQYTYRVMARDKSDNQNETTWSSSQSDTTETSDVTPPSPNPSTWSTVPYKYDSTTIVMVATTATDSWPANVEYYFDETSGNPGGSDSGWQWGSSHTDTGLSSAYTYTYQVRTRDESPNWNTGDWSTTEDVDMSAGFSFTDDFETNFDKWTDGGATDWDRTTSQKHGGSYSAHAGSSDNDLISDNLDASGCSSMTISFYYRDDDIDDGDNIYLQLYDNTSAYDNYYELGNSTEDTWNYYNQTIYNSGGDTQYFHSTFRIKFEGSSIDLGENLWIDDVSITGS